MEIPVVSLGRKLSPYLKIAAAIVLVVLISLAGIRLFSWHAQGEQTRLITLVNPWNPVTETGYSVKLTGAEDGFQVDRACAEALRHLLEDCRAAGRNPKLTSAYRSVDDQLVIHDEEAQRLVDGGATPEEAAVAVAKLIADPGRSEHELGLSVDILDGDLPEMDESQAETPTGQWLAENAWKYGFIQRYPKGAEEITGYSWHPWHYRYVGEDVAQNIYSLGITLEEYLSLFYSDEAAVVYEH